MSATHLTDPIDGRVARLRTLRAAIVGAGFMGRVHAEAARRAGASFDAFVADTYRAVRGGDVPDGARVSGTCEVVA